MEVHSHTHTLPIAIGRKKWTHYLWEFLMLFLAVFCGFLAENLRERRVEKERAKVFAQSLSEDLKKDTAALHSGIILSDNKINAADDILMMVHNSREHNRDTAFYKDMVSIISASPFIPTDGTYTQMKASGALRYFDQSLVNLMNAYDVQLKKSKYRDEVEDRGTWVLADLNFNILNFEVVSDIRFGRPITHNMYIRIADNATSDKFINLIVINKIFRFRTLQEYNVQLKIAETLMEKLKREYHLE